MTNLEITFPSDTVLEEGDKNIIAAFCENAESLVFSVNGDKLFMFDNASKEDVPEIPSEQESSDE